MMDEQLKEMTPKEYHAAIKICEHWNKLLKNEIESLQNEIASLKDELFKLRK